jgi:hypothetical protein
MHHCGLKSLGLCHSNNVDNLTDHLLLMILGLSFLGVFAELRKGTVSFVMSLRLYVRPPAHPR